MPAVQRVCRSSGLTQTPPTSAPKRPPPQPGWQPFVVAEKYTLTPEQLTLARSLWLEGTPAQVVARELGVSYDVLKARMADQLADLPRRGRGYGSHHDRGRPDPTPLELRAITAAIRARWPDERWNSDEPPDG